MTKPTLQQQYEAELADLHKRISHMELVLARVEQAIAPKLAKEKPRLTL